jgi:hypothetical protein
MRHHGYAFAAPTFPAGGVVDGANGGSQPHYNKRSPAFRHTVKTCNKKTGL